MPDFPRWSYALSLAHAAVQSWKTVPYTLHFVFVDHLDVAKGPDPGLYRECVALFLAYIALDSVVHWRALGPGYRVHHALTAAGAVYNAMYGPHAIGLCVLSNEVSTIFLSAKALLNKSHVMRPFVYQCFGWSFFFFRVLLNTLLVVSSVHVSFECAALMISIWGMNMVWFAQGFLLKRSKTTA
jgi:hypothetical protein